MDWLDKARLRLPEPNEGNAFFIFACVVLTVLGVIGACLT